MRNLGLLTAVLLPLVAACVGGLHGDNGSLHVSRVWVEPASPAAGVEAIVYVEYVDTWIRSDDIPDDRPDPPDVSVSAGIIAPVTGERLLVLRSNLRNSGHVFSWQTPMSPQTVTIHASYPDGGKTIKVDVTAAECAL
ncbi:hypothetical protein JW859_13595 [bacterium]|nr:hypothetical protein [bacterium]